MGQGYSSSISLYNLDAKNLIKKVLPKLPTTTLVYLGPPYYVKGKGLYEDHYKHEDNAKITNLDLNSISQPWIVSYDNVEPICALYRQLRQLTFGIKYSAGTASEGI